jgi:hypothetical protein
MKRKSSAITHLVEFELGSLDLVGDGESVTEGRDRLSDLREGEVEVVGTVSTSHLLLGLLSESDDTDLLSLTLSVFDILPGSLGDRRVDTTAETTVRRGDNVEDLLDLGFGFRSLGLIEDGLVGSTVGLGTFHSTLSASETGSGNHLLGSSEEVVSECTRMTASHRKEFVPSSTW